MALLTYHSARRGFLGFLTYILGSDGVSRGGVIPAMTLTDSSGAEITSFGGGGVAQGSTTAGQTGTLVQGAVTTADPAYTTAQTAPLSLTAGGYLRSQVQGVEASGVAVASRPLGIGGVGSDTVLSAVTANQRTNAWYTRGGAAVVCLGTRTAGLNTDNTSNGTILSAIGADGAAGQLMTAPFLFNGTTWDRAVKSNAAYRLLSSAATTNATSVKATAGNLFKISGNNTVASKRYLKFYNKTSAPTVGTDTPVLTFVILASAPFAIDIGSSVGHYFSTGIAYAITGAAADADTTAIAAGDIECMNLTYS